MAKKIGVKITLEAADVQLTEYLSADTAQKLELFSSASYGTSHPSDQERWYTFLFAAYDEQAEEKLSTEFLQRWLEAQKDSLAGSRKWSDDQVERMASEYSKVQFILQKYNRYKNGLRFWP